MCGIVGAVARRDVPQILIEGLLRLEYRGYDSAGLAVISSQSGEVERRRTLGKVKGLIDRVNAEPVQGTTGIAHTRWATHGVPSEANAHPHASGNDLMLVHNGIIENHAELRQELQAQGFHFSSETDTEVIVHLIARELAKRGDLIAAVQASIEHLEGAYAIGVICKREPNLLVAARHGSPLVVGIGIGENFIASDVLALRAVTDRFVYLEEGDLAALTTDRVRFFRDGKPVERKTVRVELGAEDLDKGNYRHHMLKEIHEQPRVVRKTLEGRLGRRMVLEESFGVAAKDIFDRAESITIVACGTSFYSGAVARYWIEEIAGVPCQVEIASEYRYRKSVPLKNSLFVTISQSGETADTLAALRLARQSKQYIGSLAFCNVPTSSLVRESDISFLLQAGPEIGVASTKAFTAMLVDLLLLAILIGRRHGFSPEQEAKLVQSLHDLPSTVEEVLRLDDDIRKLSARFIQREHALFLGRGAMYPVAMEGALKLKEISYIHAEGYPAGELKHGPLALVDKHMPVVAVAPKNDLVEKLLSNLEEVKARGGELFLFADHTMNLHLNGNVTVMPMPSVSETLAPILYTIPLQLLAYHTAVLKGTDVDQPRNLAKSVTVE